jgi:hypothetical protein
MAALLALVALSAATPQIADDYRLPPAKAPVAADHRMGRRVEDRPDLPRGPAWTYRSKRGPVVEVAALGGEIKEAPKLAHVAFNWKF